MRRVELCAEMRLHCVGLVSAVTLTMRSCSVYLLGEWRFKLCKHLVDPNIFDN
jgi:hypothetical protein